MIVCIFQTYSYRIFVVKKLKKILNHQLTIFLFMSKKLLFSVWIQNNCRMFFTPTKIINKYYSKLPDFNKTFQLNFQQFPRVNVYKKELINFK